NQDDGCPIEGIAEKEKRNGTVALPLRQTAQRQSVCAQGYQHQPEHAHGSRNLIPVGANQGDQGECYEYIAKNGQQPVTAATIIWRIKETNLLSLVSRDDTGINPALGLGGDGVPGRACPHKQDPGMPPSW